MAVGSADQLELSDYLRILQKRWKIVALTLIVVIGTAVALTALQDPTYNASARVLISGNDAQAVLGAEVATRTRDIQNELEFARSDTVRQAVAETHGSGGGVSVSAESNSDVLVFRSTATDPQVAADTVNNFADVFLEQRALAIAAAFVQSIEIVEARIAELGEERESIVAQIIDGDPSVLQASRIANLDNEELALRETLSNLRLQADVTDRSVVQVVQRAVPPASPASPSWPRNVALAVVVGTLLAAGAALAMESLDSTVTSKRTFETALGGPVLAQLPPPPGARAGKKPAAKTLADPYFEAIRALRSAVMFTAEGAGYKSLVVTSPHAGEGKSLTAANLAMSLAKADLRTVLVDCDLRKPRVGQIFGLDSHETGLTDALVNGAAFELFDEAVSGHPNLSVMVAGRPVAEPAELLSSDRFDAALLQLEERFDFVVIDAAPLLPVSDTQSIASAAHSVLLVARYGETKSESVATSAELLSRLDAVVFGGVLTAVPDADRGYGYGYTAHA